MEAGRGTRYYPRLNGYEVPMSRSTDDPAALSSAPLSGAAAVAFELAVVGIVYFVLATASLALASINPSVSPIWPPTGFALAVVLLRGYRVAPAILVAAFAV